MFGWEREEAWQRFADAQDLQLALADVRRAVDDLRLYVAHKRIAALELELKYRPDQPRVPAGYREGGQWTSDGNGTPSAARQRERVDDLGGEIATALGLGGADAAERAPPRTSYRVDILEEDRLGGHTYKRHVGKDDAFLLDRVRAGQGRVNLPFFAMRFGVLRAGSFSSLAAANALTSSTLAQNSDIVDAVAAGKFGRRSQFVSAVFGSATGREAYANTTNQSVRMRTTFGVGVWVQYAPEIPKGYVVVTAFPRNP